MIPFIPKTTQSKPKPEVKPEANSSPSSNPSDYLPAIVMPEDPSPKTSSLIKYDSPAVFVLVVAFTPPLFLLFLFLAFNKIPFVDDIMDLCFYLLGILAGSYFFSKKINDFISSWRIAVTLSLLILAIYVLIIWWALFVYQL